ncbi:MAG: hypothetical protein ACLR0U_10810 [Enterocloster clostridioformis]
MKTYYIAWHGKTDLPFDIQDSVIETYYEIVLCHKKLSDFLGKNAFSKETFLKSSFVAYKSFKVNSFIDCKSTLIEVKLVVLSGLLSTDDSPQKMILTILLFFRVTADLYSGC